MFLKSNLRTFEEGEVIMRRRVLFTSFRIGATSAVTALLRFIFLKCGVFTTRRLTYIVLEIFFVNIHNKHGDWFKILSKQLKGCGVGVPSLPSQVVDDLLISRVFGTYLQV